jgi:hypothetical protein
LPVTFTTRFEGDAATSDLGSYKLSSSLSMLTQPFTELVLAIFRCRRRSSRMGVSGESEVRISENDFDQ